MAEEQSAASTLFNEGSLNALIHRQRRTVQTYAARVTSGTSHHGQGCALGLLTTLSSQLKELNKASPGESGWSLALFGDVTVPFLLSFMVNGVELEVTSLKMEYQWEPGMGITMTAFTGAIQRRCVKAFESHITIFMWVIGIVRDTCRKLALPQSGMKLASRRPDERASRPNTRQHFGINPAHYASLIDDKTDRGKITDLHPSKRRGCAENPTSSLTWAETCGEQAAARTERSSHENPRCHLPSLRQQHGSSAAI
ncbi:hypothetical protein Bbelb_208110 [Branchiostoma belcheri]|nr:hypothetical protein Bbelb_208110 [Branchiostoma belcheri]